MLINLGPLRKYSDYRRLYLSQIISFLGSMVSYVTVPYQVYEITKSSFLVGLIGAVELVPILVFGLIGGSLADSVNRKKLLVISESIMSLSVLGLALNSAVATPNLILIYILVALLQSANAFHRPCIEAMTQQFVKPEDYAAVASLGTFRYSFGAVIGPSLGGILIASFGIAWAYVFDFFTFVIALVLILMIRRFTPISGEKRSVLLGIKEGLAFAIKKPELIGTYFIDIAAMTFAFPLALFPAMAEPWGGAKPTGILFSSMAIGSLGITLFSGWTKSVKSHGKAVVISATCWGLAIIILGFAPNLWTAVACLVLAGAADTVSGVFRGTIWNQTIPNFMRGRLAGLEMISYMSGPMLGNMRAGWMATAWGIYHSIWLGGLMAVVAVIFTAYFLPRFWSYNSEVKQI